MNNYPTFTNSKTKLGAIISFIATTILIFLPLFGVKLEESLIQKILWTIDSFGGLMAIYGLRNAIYKNLNSAQSNEFGELNENKPIQ